jgi:NADPH-dependent F420 reductase
MTIAVLGGTGQEGSGLALRWANTGHDIILGSRSAERAAATAAQLTQKLRPGARICGATNVDAARVASVIVLTVPFTAQVATADEVRAELMGKILVDVTVPLVPPRVDRVQLPAAESVVVALQRRLGAEVKVVSAFQNVAAEHLHDLAHEIECDVLVCGDDAKARETVIGLAADAGMRAWHAGMLVNSLAAETLTSVLIAINKRYKVPGAGIRITTPAKQ